MSKSKQFILTSEEDIVKRFRDFSVAHSEHEYSIKWDEVSSSSNTHIITGVANCSNGDSLHYDDTTITLGDVHVSVVMLTLKHGDNVDVYLAPYGGGKLDVFYKDGNPQIIVQTMEDDKNGQ